MQGLRQKEARKDKRREVLILSASWGKLKPTVLSETRARGKVEG